jgi:hypothetical protein
VDEGKRQVESLSAAQKSAKHMESRRAKFWFYTAFAVGAVLAGGGHIIGFPVFEPKD